MADKDTPYTAEWAVNLAHKSDPNRVSSIQMMAAADLVSPTPPVGGSIAQRFPAAPTPPPPATSPKYYDVSMLKSPLWKWEIATYFYLGGLSAGAYVLGRLADRAGGERHRDISRAAAYLAFAAILPAPPLLIHDLGDPKRFHHMLRVWKPTSPMNLGTWAIMAYSGVATVDVLRQYMTDRGIRRGTAEHDKLVKLMNNGKLLLVNDAAGIPIALLVATYTGVLLSSSANPMWCKNAWISPLFVASAISCGAEAITLALECTSSADSPSKKMVRHIDSAAHVAEMGLIRGYLHTAGEKAAPFHAGKMRKYHQLTNGGIIASELLKLLPLPAPLKKIARILSALAGLTAGFSMRWSFIFAGHEAANDPRIARLAGAGKPVAAANMTAPSRV